MLRSSLLAFILVFVYQAALAILPAPLLPVQKQLFVIAYEKFVTDIRGAHAELKVPADLTPPVFDPAANRRQWLEIFIDHTAQKATFTPAQLETFKTIAREMHLSYPRNKAYARVPFLAEESAVRSASAEIKSNTPVPLPATYLPNHTLDMVAYVSERFPAALQNFVKAHEVPMYLHDSTCDEAYAFQRTQGFGHFIRFMGARDSVDSQFFFVSDKASKKFRFAVCDLRGEDDKTRIVQILGPVFHQTGARLILHAKRAPLLTLNQDALDLKVDPVLDRVLIGFQSTVWWQFYLSSKDWQRYPLTDEGPDLSLFLNAKTGQKVISLGNVYGDEIVEALTLFYDKGYRRFVYLGSCGGIDENYQLGDVILPNKFFEKSGQVFSFVNTAAELPLLVPAGAKVLRTSLQGWVSTLALETKEFMLGLRRRRVQALDVESVYVAKFMNSHREITEHSILLTVSDNPLGTTTYQQENLTREIPMNSVKMIVPQLFLKAAANDDKRKVSSIPFANKKAPLWLGPDHFETEW